ncbi:MAG TPA: TonB-dependent receptor, partial [Flavobacteriaceae bacterium]|nr:TonB-dependent receptor [Flavobacteriaceae bacterium]
MKFSLSIVFVCLSIFCNAQETGSITGKLTDKEAGNTPLAFANILVKGTSKGTISDFDGNYIIENIAPGNYTLIFSFVGYKTVEIGDVKVVANQTIQVDASLAASAAALDQVIVKAKTSRELESALLFEQKDAIVMKQAIGAQELARKGIGNVAEGVVKISGIAKQESRGIVVRGLGERYNFLTVNGLPMITGNPDKKIIPLDKFTTDIVRNINVYKTFNADLSGDFAGASFDIVTKDIPTKPVTSIKIGVSGNSQTTFQSFKTDEESAVEGLGISGNNRDLPTVYGKNLKQLGYASTPEASKTLFGTGFNVEEYDAPLASSLEIIHGNGFDQNKEKNTSFGYYMGFNFENNFSTIPGASLKNLNTQGGFNSNYRDVEEYSLTTKKSSLISLQFDKRDKFRLKFNNIFIQTTSNFTREQFGYNSEANDDFFARISRYRETIINQTQLLGDWNLAENNRHQVEFGTSYGFGFYNEPDRKLLYSEGKGPNSALFISNSSEPNRYYADLDIRNLNGFLEYNLGLGAANGFNEDEFSHNLTLGADANHLKYDYFNRVVRLNVDPTAFPSGAATIKDIPLNTNNPDEYIYQGFDQGWLNYEDGSDA